MPFALFGETHGEDNPKNAQSGYIYGVGTGMQQVAYMAQLDLVQYGDPDMNVEVADIEKPTLYTMEVKQRTNTHPKGALLAVEDSELINVAIDQKVALAEIQGLEAAMAAEHRKASPDSGALKVLDQAIKLARKDIPSLYKFITEDFLATDEGGYEFFDIYVNDVDGGPADSVEDVGLENHVQGVVLNDQKFYDYSYSIRTLFNQLLMFFHIANGLLESRMQLTREIHDEYMDGDHKGKIKKIRSTTDKQFSKFTKGLNSFQSAMNSGVDQLSDQLMGFASNTNDAVSVDDDT
jgi:hypothetical protein